MALVVALLSGEEGYVLQLIHLMLRRKEQTLKILTFVYERAYGVSFKRMVAL